MNKMIPVALIAAIFLVGCKPTETKLVTLEDGRKVEITVEKLPYLTELPDPKQTILTECFRGSTYDNVINGNKTNSRTCNLALKYAEYMLKINGIEDKGEE